MESPDHRIASDERGARRWWPFGEHRNRERPLESDVVGWSYILFGNAVGECPESLEVRERAVQMWLTEHGIAAARAT